MSPPYEYPPRPDTVCSLHPTGGSLRVFGQFAWLEGGFPFPPQPFVAEEDELSDFLT